MVMSLSAQFGGGRVIKVARKFRWKFYRCITQTRGELNNFAEKVESLFDPGCGDATNTKVKTFLALQ